MSCGVGSSPAKAVALHSDCNENYFVISFSIGFNDLLLWHTDHIMKTENPTNTRKVQLMPIIANVQKLISPSPVEQKHFHCKDYNRHQVLTENVIIPTWEVVSADLLRKMLVVLLHLLGSKMAQTFCPQGCHSFFPQEGFGVRLRHSIKFKGEVQSICPHRGVAFPYRLLGFHIT